MNKPEIEQILSQFKLKDSPPATRERALAAARAAWNETPQPNTFWSWHTWRWPTYYAAAAALLLLLNGIVTSLDQGWTKELIAEKSPAIDEPQTALEQLYAELGRDPADARRLRILAARHAPRGDINDFLRRQNHLLQATELL